ncbi:MAG: adenosine deaminase [Acidimicrobiales bacterium]
MGPAPDRAWITEMPKAEVHLHLEGCLHADLVAAAAGRRAAPGEPDRGDGDGRPVIGSLPELLSYLDWSCALIDRADDLTTVAERTALRAAAVGVGHVDVIVNPTHWPHWQGRLPAMVDALDRGFAAAERRCATTAALCVSLKRTQSAAEALSLVDRILEAHHRRVAALSIDGDETDGSRNEEFAEAFARAAAGGLRRCAHAGESSGPDGVREAVEVLGAERIDHGIRAVEDPGLVEDLERWSVPLDVCLTSNVVLGIVPDLARHPVEVLRRAGVAVSLNTDDPLLYGIDVAGEYALGATAYGWGRTELAAMARTSISSCFAPAGRRAQLEAELDAFLARPGG